LEARGFTPEHFRTFHPGGQLGANLTHVGDIMHSGEALPVVPLGTGMRDAVTVLSRKRFGCVCVIDGEGKLAGIITDGDLARNLDRSLGELVVEDVMTRAPKTVKPQMMASAAIAILNQHNISALVVVEDERPVGVVHFHDLLRIGVA
jgi:arabinose-5-phosphate isomerase